MTKENQAKVASDLMTYTTINDNDIEGLLNAFRPGLDFFFASDLTGSELQWLFLQVCMYFNNLQFVFNHTLTVLK